MLETIVSLLKSAGVSAWEVADVTTKGWEFYFIRHELDQNRVKDVEHINVKVYQETEGGKFLGSASCEIPPSATREEAEELIRSLSFRASLVKNKPYTLNPPRKAEKEKTEAVDVASIARVFLETMRNLPETETEDINSYEIFVSEKKRRLITSTGIDVEESYPDSMIEVVINARKDGHEIELYRSFQSGKCDAEMLRRELARAMKFGKDRLAAKPTPALGKADVVLTTGDACEVYAYFADRMNSALVYRGMSDWKPGTPICEAFRGDRITLSAVKELPNSSGNRNYDAEGAPIRDVIMIRDGIAEKYLGSRMFSAYLGLEEAFQPTNYVVSGGSGEETELKRGPYLEIVEFSDFQVDSMTGDLFGEIRLAYWYDGNTVTPVSGGSISGSMLELSEKMEMSEKSTQYDNWLIPAVTRLCGVTVTGIGASDEC